MFHVKHASTLTLPLADGVRLKLERTAPTRESGSAHQRIAVATTRRFGRLYTLDGDGMASAADESAIHESLAHLAALAHAAPSSALILGGGDGGSARELLKHPSIADITIAELDPLVVDLIRAEWPDLPAGAFDDPRVRLSFGDAADTLRTLHDAGRRFDLILFDLTAADDPACAHLHGDDFLRLCAAALNPGGCVHIQLGSPFYQPDKIHRLAQRLRRIFPFITPALIHVPLYGGPWLLAVASLHPPTPTDVRQLTERMIERRIAGLRYYNPGLHLAAASLPNYVSDLLA